MFSKEDLNLLKVIKENNFVSKKIFRNARTGRAFLSCLEVYKWDDDFFKDNLERLAKHAEEDFLNYILNFKRDSFYSPYCEIVQEFYDFTEEEITNLAEKWIDAHIIL